MPNPTNNKLVDSKTIAALFDMTPRRVQQLTKDGVIAAVKEGNANRYDLLPTIQRYIRYLTAKANGREPSKKDSEIEGRRLEAEADLKPSKADIAALQLSELEGTMHRSEDVEAVMTDLVYNIRSMLVALPGRLAVDVTGSVFAVIALLLLIDNSRGEPLKQLRFYLGAFSGFIRKTAVAVGVTHMDLQSSPSRADYQVELDRAGQPGVPVFEVDARSRRDVCLLIEAVLSVIDPVARA